MALPSWASLRISACCNQGGRKHMEDRVSIHCQRGDCGQIDYIFIGVFDGHGGADASQFAKVHLRENIIAQQGFWSTDDDEVLSAIKNGFIQTHNDMWKVVDKWPKTASGFTSTSGTTATIAFMKNGKLYTGHVGDSAIALGTRRPDGTICGTRLTVDHKPDSPGEQKRIYDLGGEVMTKAGVMRVVWIRPTRGHQGPIRRSTEIEKIPFLAVARSLGDLWSYNSMRDDFIVSPIPDVSVLPLKEEDVCLVMGSDGVWNVLNCQNAIDIVNSHEWKEIEQCPLENPRNGLQTNHARWIVRHALIRWGCTRADNVSIIVVLFDAAVPVVEHESYATICEDRNLDIEKTLVEAASAMITISAETTIALKTKPVELIYYGIVESFDQSQGFLAAVKKKAVENGVAPPAVVSAFSGPGYTMHGEEIVALTREHKENSDVAGDEAEKENKLHDSGGECCSLSSTQWYGPSGRAPYRMSLRSTPAAVTACIKDHGSGTAGNGLSSSMSTHDDDDRSARSSAVASTSSFVSISSQTSSFRYWTRLTCKTQTFAEPVPLSEETTVESRRCQPQFCCTLNGCNSDGRNEPKTTMTPAFQKLKESSSLHGTPSLSPRRGNLPFGSTSCARFIRAKSSRNGLQRNRATVDSSSYLIHSLNLETTCARCLKAGAYDSNLTSRQFAAKCALSRKRHTPGNDSRRFTKKRKLSVERSASCTQA